MMNDEVEVRLFGQTQVTAPLATPRRRSLGKLIEPLATKDFESADTEMLVGENYCGKLRGLRTGEEERDETRC